MSMEMRAVSLRSAGFALVLSAALGCDSAIGPKGEERIGIIDYWDHPVVITVPDTVQVDKSFEVTIRTYGDGCFKGGVVLLTFPDKYTFPESDTLGLHQAA